MSASEQYKEHAADGSARKSVLVCVLDNDRAEADLVTDFLTRAGFSAVGTADPQEALAEVRAGSCRIILVNFTTPAMDSLSFLDECLKSDPGMCVILISGHASVDSAIQAIRHGAYDYLCKPLDFPRLVRTLDDLPRVFLKRENPASNEKFLGEPGLGIAGEATLQKDTPAEVGGRAINPYTVENSTESLKSDEPPKPLDEVRRLYIRHVLETCDGNRVRAAHVLGIGRTSLYRFLKREEKDATSASQKRMEVLSHK